MKRRLLIARFVFALLTLGLCALALWPVFERFKERRFWSAQISKIEKELKTGSDVALSGLDREAVLRISPSEIPLASWGNIGGCGASGGAASSTAGGAKWVGRNVTGGLLDLQCMSSQTYADGGWFTTFNTRFATQYIRKWVFGVNVPLLYKTQPVDVFGQDQRAHIVGFGDLGFEITRKLGITNSDLLTLLISAPTGSSDAVRQGVVLPQQLQLGSGTLGASLLFEHVSDLDWGLMMTGGSFSYGGWENELKDYRSPALSTWVYLGYIMGPFVPSVGLSTSVKFGHDRQRGEDLDQPLGMGIINVATEWSTDWLALLVSASAPFAADGFESLTLSLGVSTSLF